LRGSKDRVVKYAEREMGAFTLLESLNRQPRLFPEFFLLIEPAQELPMLMPLGVRNCSDHEESGSSPGPERLRLKREGAFSDLK